MPAPMCSRSARLDLVGDQPEVARVHGDLGWTALTSGDIDAARAAGIRCGAVTWGYADAGILRAQKPDFVFEAMADIAAAFQAPART